VADKWDCDWAEFTKHLQASGLIKRNPDSRYAFAAKFHKELVFVSLYLNDLAVAGGELVQHPDPPELCDFCRSEIEEVGFFVDGTTKSGAWANMCPHCYVDHGAGIGWGVGQLYRKRANFGPWLCIAGGNPEPNNGE
jgi:hypothetical protein